MIGACNGSSTSGTTGTTATTDTSGTTEPSPPPELTIEITAIEIFGIFVARDDDATVAYISSIITNKGGTLVNEDEPAGSFAPDQAGASGSFADLQFSGTRKIFSRHCLQRRHLGA